jgi:hypothetical protein
MIGCYRELYCQGIVMIIIIHNRHNLNPSMKHPVWEIMSMYTIRVVYKSVDPYPAGYPRLIEIA